MIEEEIVRKLVSFLFSFNTDFRFEKRSEELEIFHQKCISFLPRHSINLCEIEDLFDERKTKAAIRKKENVRFLSSRLNETRFRGWLSRSCEERSSICKERCSISWLTAYFSRLCVSGTRALALSFHAISFSSWGDLLPEKLRRKLCHHYPRNNIL